MLEHGGKFPIHERLAACEADEIGSEPVPLDFVQVGGHLRGGDVGGETVVARRRLDVAARTPGCSACRPIQSVFRRSSVTFVLRSPLAVLSGSRNLGRAQGFRGSCHRPRQSLSRGSVSPPHQNACRQRFSGRVDSRAAARRNSARGPSARPRRRSADRRRVSWRPRLRDRRRAPYARS